MKIVDRKTKKEKDLVYDKSLLFLYHNFFGRILLRIAYCPFISKIVGKYMDSKLSIRRIAKTIKKSNIDMSKYEKKDYVSFNDFFIRKKKNITIDKNKNSFIAPADSKLLVIKLNKEASFDIKKSIYNLKNIINKDLSKEYQNGYALIFRLATDDYHRFHYIDDGTRDDYEYIKGIFHTVQPIAYEKYPIFHKNSREYTILHTKNFGDVIEVDVGAILIGKIVNHKEKKVYHKGEEKGYFKFGGSTVVLFVKDNVIEIDNDILMNSTLGKETIVTVGEKIGTRINKKGKEM